MMHNIKRLTIPIDGCDIVVSVLGCMLCLVTPPSVLTYLSR